MREKLERGNGMDCEISRAVEVSAVGVRRGS